MSFGVDTLGGLTEKLKQLVNDTQSLYESFIDANQLFKAGKITDKEFFASIGQYLVASSALTFLAVRVVLEMKGAMDKGTSIKSPTGGVAAPPGSQAGFGIGGFVGAGGSVGPSAEYVLPSPQTEPTFRPVDIEVPRRQTKSCIICGATIPAQAKFCSKCGRSQ